MLQVMSIFYRLISLFILVISHSVVATALDDRFVVKYELYHDKEPNKLSFVDILTDKKDGLDNNGSVINSINNKEKKGNVLNVAMVDLYPEDKTKRFKEHISANRVHYIISYDDSLIYKQLSTHPTEGNIDFDSYFETLSKMKKKGYLLYKSSNTSIPDDINKTFTYYFEFFLVFKKVFNHGFYLSEKDRFINSIEQSIKSNNYDFSIQNHDFKNERNYRVIDIENGSYANFAFMKKINYKEKNLIVGNLTLDGLFTVLNKKYEMDLPNIVDIEKIYSQKHSAPYWVAVINKSINKYKFGVYSTEAEMKKSYNEELKKGYHPVDISIGVNGSIGFAQPKEFFTITDKY